MLEKTWFKVKIISSETRDKEVVETPISSTIEGRLYHLKSRVIFN